jgi:hypothetical protein
VAPAKAESVCHLCGCTSFSRGLLYGYRFNVVKFVKLREQGTGFWKHFTQKGERVHARLCQDCGNVQLFAGSRFDAETESSIYY